MGFFLAKAYGQFGNTHSINNPLTDILAKKIIYFKIYVFLRFSIFTIKSFIVDRNAVNSLNYFFFLSKWFELFLKNFENSKQKHHFFYARLHYFTIPMVK